MATSVKKKMSVKKLLIGVDEYNKLFLNPSRVTSFKEESHCLLIDVSEYEKLQKNRALSDFYKRNCLFELSSHLKKHAK